MKEGPFALIDCLGFKGIWAKHDPADVISKLKKIESTVLDNINPLSKGDIFPFFSYGPAVIKVTLLSDTVAISLQYSDEVGMPDERQQNILVGVMCHAVARVIDLFIDNPAPMVLRGCITYGKHLSEGNFIVGPAVDEAAAYMNEAEGAFVWLLPEAEKRYLRMSLRLDAFLESIPAELTPTMADRLRKRHPNAANDVGEVLQVLDSVADDASGMVGAAWIETLKLVSTIPIVVYPYAMPLKSGAKLTCALVNPTIGKRNEDECESLLKRYYETFNSNRLDVWLKRQNTMEFLGTAIELTTRFNERFTSLQANRPPDVESLSHEKPISSKSN